MTVTTAQYSEQSGLTVTQARMKLEWMTAAGMAKRYTFSDRGAQFTLRDNPAKSPIRVHNAERPPITMQTTKDIQAKVVALLTEAGKPVTTAHVREQLHHPNVSYTSAVLHKMQRGGLIDSFLVGQQRRWRLA